MKGAEQGFTLIEVIVALVVVSLTLTLIMSGALDAKARRLRAQDRDKAILLASSLIAAQRIKPAGVNVQTGTTNGIAWEVRESELARDPRGFYVFDRIEVVLSDRHGEPLYAVATRKLKPVAE